MIGIDEKHSIQKRNGKRVVVCNGHFCGVYFRKFLDSEYGSTIVISGVIVGLTFGIALLLTELPLVLELSGPYPMIFDILGLAWIPIGLVLMMKYDHIFKRIYPDWGFEDMTEAFRSQI